MRNQTLFKFQAQFSKIENKLQAKDIEHLKQSRIWVSYKCTNITKPIDATGIYTKQTRDSRHVEQ